MRRWPADAQSDLLEAYGRIETPVLLLWADRDGYHSLAGAEEALDLLPGTGSCSRMTALSGVARELPAFCLQR